jgi:hypothetical protein
VHVRPHDAASKLLLTHTCQLHSRYSSACTHMYAYFPAMVTCAALLAASCDVVALPVVHFHRTGLSACFHEPVLLTGDPVGLAAATPVTICVGGWGRVEGVACMLSVTPDAHAFTYL